MELLTGIQQVGIGVPDADAAKIFYRNDFGMNVKVFDDVATASLMTGYTGNKEQQRRAILSMNMTGGGGFEIWQFLSRTPTAPQQNILLGDPGIFAVKIKTQNIKAAYRYFENSGSTSLSPIFPLADNRSHFWVKDQLGNWFNVVEGTNWFQKQGAHCGGVQGAVIGVSNMENALHFYADMLGIDEEVYNLKGPVTDMPGQQDGQQPYHRVLLRKKTSAYGAFSRLLGDIEIELVQSLSKIGQPIFNNRYWGDLGFIHLCFDVTNMDALKQRCKEAGYPFTVDSGSSFSMENAAGRFCYVEDTDGTLLELVETHRVPIVKKLGWYINLKKRNNNRPLPNWMIRMLGLSKIK
jgi:catechol 2,3-dioxygenase-like lactoylglutathione lyase family enzyme